MPSLSESVWLENALRLIQLFLDNGNAKGASALLYKVLETHQDNSEIQRRLAYLNILNHKLDDACVHINRAVILAPPDKQLQAEANTIRSLVGETIPSLAMPENPDGKFRFTKLYDRLHHRSGWQYAVDALHTLNNSDGVMFEGMLEEPFARHHPQPGKRSGATLLAAIRQKNNAAALTSEERQEVPYKQPWVGFLHNPPNMPDWFHGAENPKHIFEKDIWKQSLEHCAGLFTLSEYLAQWLRKETGVTVSSMLHPSETPEKQFEYDRFIANDDKKIIQIGWWLRRLGAIDRLPIPKGNKLNYSKIRLMPNFFTGAYEYLRDLRDIENQHEYRQEGCSLAAYAENTIELNHVPNDVYDDLLMCNICFVDLYDASANNAVIECIVRTTPILVNRLPAVEEYLGVDYPLYFSDLRDAAHKALDVGRIKATHEYLCQLDTRHKLDSQSFIDDVNCSEVYRGLKV